MSGGINMI